MLKKQRQQGLTLVELMIGLLVGTIIAAGAISAFNNTLKSNTDNLNISKLNQDMRAMMDIMVREIRRASYATSVPTFNDGDADGINDALSANPFNTVTVGDDGTCIVFMYNRNYDSENNLAAPVVDDNERLGFKLVGTQLMMRSSSATLPCADGAWESLTEPEVEITTLGFVLDETASNITSMLVDDLPAPFGDGVMDGDDNNNQNCDPGEACNICILDGAPDPACVFTRTVHITLIGRLRTDNVVTQRIDEQVRIRNDRFVAAVP